MTELPAFIRLSVADTTTYAELRNSYVSVSEEVVCKSH